MAQREFELHSREQKWPGSIACMSRIQAHYPHPQCRNFVSACSAPAKDRTSAPFTRQSRVVCWMPASSSFARTLSILGF